MAADNKGLPQCRGSMCGSHTYLPVGVDNSRDGRGSLCTIWMRAGVCVFSCFSRV